MTETHPHNGRIPTGPALTLLALLTAGCTLSRLTPEQLQTLQTALELVAAALPLMAWQRSQRER